MPSRAIKRSAPTRMTFPSTVAETPYPVIETKPLTGGKSIPPALAACTMASAIGCSEVTSTAATSRSTSSLSNPSAALRSVSAGRPLVSVPVLSTATIVVS